MAKSSALTPMLRHYLEVKAQHPDAFLFYRMGDFYELFFDDAVAAAPLLEVTLTARHKGKDSETPMCGVPHHAVDSYIQKLVAGGHRVAICEQVEDPATAKGLVRREVTRVVTPGTLSDPQILDGRESSVVVAVEWENGGGAGAFLEVATGDFFVAKWTSMQEATEDLRLYEPREILLPHDESGEIRTWGENRGLCVTQLANGRTLDTRAATQLLEDQFGAASLRGFGLEKGEPAVRAAGNVLSYALETQGSDLPHIENLRVRAATRGLILDSTTLANLEVFRSARDASRRGTLLSVLDRTATASGGRLLKQWLKEPLREVDAIDQRLDAVAELVERAREREDLGEALKSVSDVERILARASLGSMTPPEAAALRETLRTAPTILAGLEGSKAELLQEIGASDPVAGLLELLQSKLRDEPSASIQRGGVIADGVDAELDECRCLAQDSKHHILQLQERERERTGIGSLKIRYNKVFGYYIEVTKSNLDAVPEDYTRKQTLVNAERFITPEVKELEQQILGAEERQLVLEAEYYQALQAEVVAFRTTLLVLARAIATLDVLVNLASIAERHRYSRPRLTEPGGEIVIRDGRHPVVERLGQEAFVPNDTELGNQDDRIVVLTGPNMGGKSTYLRQVALIVLMAQVGSFVPAAEASIGLVDRVFTRVGASDDLTRGESTFMVEMIETSNILRYATAHSLVVLDEVGRGTATFDGLSLAWAIVEYLDAECGAKTLFATHYHELTELAALSPAVCNRTMLVKEWEDRIVFLRRVVEGRADKSYGIHVARLAGLPPTVLDRARELLDNLESQEYDLSGNPRIARGSEPSGPGPDQLNLFAPPEEIVASVVRDVDLERLSPLAALNLLVSLKSRLESSKN
jgi:DNA mismatch repair protein MutS